MNIQSQKINIKPQTNASQGKDILTALTAEFQVLDQDSSVDLEVDDFKNELIKELSTSSDLPRTLLSDLLSGISTAKDQQESLTNELLTYNQHRFATLKKYIQAEYDETAEMQNIIDLLEKDQKLLAFDTQFQMVSQSI